RVFVEAYAREVRDGGEGKRGQTRDRAERPDKLGLARSGALAHRRHQVVDGPDEIQATLVVVLRVGLAGSRRRLVPRGHVHPDLLAPVALCAPQEHEGSLERAESEITITENARRETGVRYAVGGGRRGGGRVADVDEQRGKENRGRDAPVGPADRRYPPPRR